MKTFILSLLAFKPTAWAYVGQALFGVVIGLVLIAILGALLP